jgi:CubicO group peptidase (beta-lactamase class C family)
VTPRVDIEHEHDGRGLADVVHQPPQRGHCWRARAAALAALVSLSGACTAAAVDLSAPGATAAVPGATAAVARQLEVETRVTSAGGATLVAPKGWFVTPGRELIVLEDADRALTLTFVEVRDATALEAIAAAWTKARPGFARAIRRTSAPPPEPWDEMLRVEYETTVAEARYVAAIGRRKEGTWYVTLFDGPRAAFDRRRAQVDTAHSSVRAPGLVRESWRGRRPHVLDAARARQLELFVEDARRRAQVPGAAVAVVQKGAIVYERGFGIRRVGGDDPVTPETLFMIGSITKPLTSLMMAVLVDRGRFTWRTPVTRLLPSFALGDAEATRRLTLQHTVCACTGLPRQDMEFFFGYLQATPESRLAAMRSMVPTTGLGETFQYSNSLVSAGGYLAARAHRPDLPLGPAYDSTMAELVLGPLGMTRTTFDFAAVERAEHAAPHGMTLAGEYTPLPMSSERWLPPIRPAGGAWSSARDMARYLLLELGDGTMPDGRPLLSAKNLLARRTPQVTVDQWSSYALALRVQDVQDITVIGHGGSTSGFSALMFFLPDHDVGAIVLANAWRAGAFTAAVRARLLELLFDGREEASRRLAFAVQQRAEGLGRARARLETEPDVTRLRPFFATYDNPALGRIRVRRDGERAVLDAGDWRSTIGYRQELDGTAKLVLLDPPWTYVELLADQVDGRPRLTLERPQHRYVFEAVGPVE